MHVLRFFLTRPSVAIQGCAPARRRIRVLTLSTAPLSPSAADSPALSAAPHILLIGFSLPSPDLDAPQTDIQIP